MDTSFTKEELELLKKIPILGYLLEPVSYIEELYVKYPDGGAFGKFAFVNDCENLAFWSIISKSWKLLPIGNGSISDKVKQELGQSTAWVVSQKKLTDELENVSTTISEVETNANGRLKIIETPWLVDIDAYLNNVELAEGLHNYGHGSVLCIEHRNSETFERDGLYQFRFTTGGVDRRRINLVTEGTQTYPEWTPTYDGSDAAKNSTANTFDMSSINWLDLAMSLSVEGNYIFVDQYNSISRPSVLPTVEQGQTLQYNCSLTGTNYTGMVNRTLNMHLVGTNRNFTWDIDGNYIVEVDPKVNPNFTGNLTVEKNLITRTDLNQSNAIGANALLNALPSSVCNEAFGIYVFQNLTTGSYNIGIGQSTGQALVDGNNNTFIGRWSGRSVTHGSANVAIGQSAGKYFDASNSIYIGDNTTATANNEIVIGQGKTGRGANTTTIGSNTTTKTYLEGEVIAPNVTVDNVLKSKDSLVVVGKNSNRSAGICQPDPDNAFQILGIGTHFTEFNAGDIITLFDENDDIIVEAPILTIISDTLIEIDLVPDFAYAEINRNISNNANKIETFGYAEKDAINNKTVFNGSLNPAFDNTYTLGTSGKLWKQLYAASSTISTSDARLKTDITPFTLDELSASKQLSKEVGTYKFLDAVKEKGDSARLHIGLTVQRAIEIMTANNLNPFAYGFICHDEWEDEFVTIPEVVGVEYRAAYTEEIKDEEGIVIDTIEHPEIEEIKAVPSYEKQTQKAGDLYSFRYTELLAFISAGFEARLTELENK